jgi:uncharacterized membrane protein YdjX (TVP38/TMEM64 family)
MDPSPRAARKALLFKLAFAAGVVVVVGLLLLRGVVLGALLDQIVAKVRAAGPAAFFSAMAVLPAFGVPALAFMLPAGPVFASTLGMPLVLALSLAALTVNMILAYWLARYALRPWLARLITRLGYTLPQVPPGDTTALIVLLRVTPGVPALAQNYLLGLADTPFIKYLLVSCLCAWPHISVYVYFGEKLREGRKGLILIAVLLLVALIAAARLVMHHYRGKSAKPAVGGPKSQV